MGIRKIGIVVGLVLIVTMAGCSTGTPGQGGDGGQATTSSTSTETRTTSSTPTETPAATTTQGSVSIDSVEFPVGLNESGYTNRSAVIANHAYILRNVSHTSVTEIKAEARLTITFRANSSTKRVHMVGKRADRENASHRYYSDALGQSVEWGAKRPSLYSVDSYWKAMFYENQFEPLRNIELGSPEAVRSGGNVYITYDVVGYRIDRKVVSGNFTIRGDGLIKEYSFTIEDGKGNRYWVRYNVSNLGDTVVEVPDYVTETAD